MTNKDQVMLGQKVDYFQVSGIAINAGLPWINLTFAGSLLTTLFWVSLLNSLAGYNG